jgi:hypothetical protein
MNRSPSLEDLQNEATWLEFRDAALPATKVTELVTTEQSRAEFLEGARLLGFDKRAPRSGDGGSGPTPIQLVITDVLAAGARLNAVLEPRRTTKSSSIMATMIGRCALRTDYAAAFTFATAGARASEFYNDEVVKYIRLSYPEGTPAPFHMVIANGKEHIRWPSRASQFRIVPPGEESFRGKGLDFIWVDEAQAATPDQASGLLRGIMPTMDTKYGAQLVVSGTAGDFRDTNLLWRVLENEQAGVVRHNAPDETDPEAFDGWEPDEERPAGQVRAMVEKYHPGVGWTTNLDALSSYFQLESASFPSEYLGIWGAEGSNTALIPQSKWQEAAFQKKPTFPEVFAMSTFVHPDALYASVAAAWRGKDGKTHVRLLHHQTGVEGFSNKLLLLWRKYQRPIIWDTKSDATAVEILKLREVRPAAPTEKPQITASIGRAAVNFLNQLNAGQLVHYDDPPLNAAVEVAVKRPWGDSGKWAFGMPKKGGKVLRDTDITGLEAAALAAFLVDDEKAHNEPVQIGFFS